MFIRTFLYQAIWGGAALSSAFAANLSINFSGRGEYDLVVSNVKDLNGMDVLITFDPQTLGNPRVSKGAMTGSAIIVGNLIGRDRYKIAMINTSPINGSGVLAVVSFDLLGSTPGKITALTSQLYTLMGEKIATDSSISGDDIQNTEAPSDGSEMTSVVRSPATVPSTAGGTSSPGPGFGTLSVSMPNNAESLKDTQSKPPMAEEINGDPVEKVPAPTEPANNAVSPQKDEPSKGGATSSVVERFKDSSGERKREALVSLLTPGIGDGATQEPSVVAADGISTVKVVIHLASSGNAPSFSVKGGKLLSIKKLVGAWELEVRTEKGSYPLALTVIQGETIESYQLTVVPKVEIDLDRSRKLGEEDFIPHLKGKKETAESSVPNTNHVGAAVTGDGFARYLDVNGDGKKDYQDDYIFTGNFLLQSMLEGRKQKIR